MSISQPVGNINGENEKSNANATCKIVDSSSDCSNSEEEENVSEESLMEQCKKIQKTLDDDKKGYFYCAYYDD